MTSPKHSESTPEPVARHGLTAPASTESRFLEALELDRFRDSRARRESLALLKAIRLAPELEICERLLAGERVPSSRLDATWLKAYGLK